jgi:DNA-binding beta-propeller fold protein YncE
MCAGDPRPIQWLVPLVSARRSWQAGSGTSSDLDLIGRPSEVCGRTEKAGDLQPNLCCVYLYFVKVPRLEAESLVGCTMPSLRRSLCLTLRAAVLAGGLLGCVYLAALAGQSAGPSGYSLRKSVRLGGAGGWDYLTLDEPTHRLFISRASHVMVVDPDQGKILGDIPNTQGVHGIALAPEFNRGYTTNGRTATSTIFELTSLKVLGEAKTEKDPDAVIYDPASKRIFTFNGDANSSTAIDAKSGDVVGSFPLGGGPEFAATDGKGHVFANLEDKNALIRVNSDTLKVENTWPLTPCESPSGLAIDAEHEILIVGCHNKLMAFVDGNSGKVLGTVPIGQGVDANRFDPGTGYAFASCGDGTLTIAHEVSPTKFSLVETLSTKRGARTMTLDPSNHNLYLVTAEFGPTPAATPENPRPRPAILPDTFTLLVYGK